MNRANPTRIYLDNAATSWPKPPAVYEAVDHYQREIGAPAGRSTYAQAAVVSRQLERLRQQLVALVHAPEDQFAAVFTYSGTDALNIVLHGWLRSGDHVVTTQAEHNSVLRPLRMLEQHRGVRVTRAAVDSCGSVDPDAMRQAIEPATRLIVVNHASNVTGTVAPLEQISQLAREHHIPLLLDAAQTLGHWPIDLEQVPVDFLAAPGHKGLLGPLGTGVLVLRRGLASQLVPLRQGGTGSDSQSDTQPPQLPDRLESGNLNVPGLFGLAAGVEWLADRGVDRIAAQQQRLAAWLVERLQGSGVALYGAGGRRRIALLSVGVTGYDPQELAAVLDATAGIQVRAGFHCAPLVHRALGTDRQGGTVRLSLGPLTTFDELETAAEVLGTLAAAG